MLRFDEYRTDKEFKIDSLSYEEIFDRFKDVVDETRKKFHSGAFRFWPVELRKDKCGCRMAYGLDKNLYPEIKLDMGGCYLLIMPYEAKLLIIENKVRQIISPDINEVLYNLMCEKFPDSDYVEKREKYFKDVELMREGYDWNL